MVRAKSVGIVALGFLIIAILSTVTDSILEANGVIPKGTLKNSSGLMLGGIIAYRAVYSLIGCYVTARLAPKAPMKHALALGVVGIVLTTLGSVAMSDKAPIWYDIVLVVMTLPIAWFAGRLGQMSAKTNQK
jgi:hypothetical protein